MNNKKILFITSRNVLTTCGELRLIKNRAQVLYTQWDITTDFIAIGPQSRLSRKREEIGAGSTMNIFLFARGIISFFKAYRNAMTCARQKLDETAYSCIILSGITTFYMAKLLKKHYPAIKIIADIHGAYDELVEFNNGNLFKSLIRRMLFLGSVIEGKWYFKYFDAALVVSHALKAYITNKFPANHLDFYIVPCAASRPPNGIDLTEAQAMRTHWRTKLGITDGDVLFIYSGGTSAWQSVDDAKRCFDELKAGLPYRCKWLIMSHKIEQLKYLEADDIIIMSFEPTDVQQVLYAGDYAFLLRGDYITNHVAFPNKFVEYLLSGMEIICTKYVYDIAEYVQEYKTGLVLESLDEAAFASIKTNIRPKRNFYEDAAVRSRLLDKLYFENSLKPLVKQFHMLADQPALHKN